MWQLACAPADSPEGKKYIAAMRAAGVALSWAKDGARGQVAVFDPDRDAGESARATLLDAVMRTARACRFDQLVVAVAAPLPAPRPLQDQDR